jgi:hypothetical protein
MQKILVAAALVTTLTVPALTADAAERHVPARDAAVGEILAPRPGAAVRETVGTAAPPPSPGRVSDDRLLVEERPPSATPRTCPADAAPAACPR